MSSPASGNRARRVICLGLDGAPYTLLRRFADEGLMPCLAETFKVGEVAAMDVALPEISAVSWSSFMTGVNPGKHGVYGFLDLDPKSYKLNFTNFRSVQAPTIWDTLSQQGVRSVVVNIPTTYPARPLQGVLVSGFVAIDLAKATYPRSLVPYLEGIGYKLDVDTTTVKVSFDAFVNELWDALAKREAALWHLLRNERWDLFIGVITETDRLQHYLWAAIEDPNHRYHQFFKDYYRRIDEFIGRVFEWIRQDDLLMIMSDHGFCKIDQEVYLNHWLRDEGYLDFIEYPPRSHQDIAPTSRAFAMDPSRIYIHTQGTYANGSVEPGKMAEQLRDEIASKLEALTIGGRRVVQELHLRESLYTGPHIARAPDLLAVPQRGFDLKGTIAKDVLHGTGSLTGMHTHDDAVVYLNRPFRKQRKPHIVDLAPTILTHLGIVPPPDLDGETL